MHSQDLADPALRLFTELLSVPAPSGREERIAAVIRAKLEDWGYQPETDGSGNVLVRLPGQKPDAPLCCLAAHMDEIALVVTRIEANGTLRVDRSGGLNPWKIGEGPVEIIGDGETRIIGVLSMGSGHSEAGAAGTRWADTWVITGLTPRQLQEAGVRPGSTAVPVREGRGPVVFGDPSDPLVAAWTFDDRMGCVALLRLLETMRAQAIVPYRPTLAAFTVHEEGGSPGAKALAHREGVETFISIDGCPMPADAPLQLDGRPGIWSKDRLAHYDQRLLVALCRAARLAKTELQPVVYAEGAASDASLVYSVGGAQRIACLGHVRENSHGYEVARLAVFENLYRTLLQFIRTWQGE